MTGSGRPRLQIVVRVGGLALVLAWLLSPSLQAAVPFWLPFAVLAASELELFARGILEARGQRRPEPPQRTLERRLPGSNDADLGWIEVEDEEGELRLVPAPATVRRRSRLPLAAGIVLAAVLFVLALRVDERESWSSLAPAERALAEQRFTREAALIAGRPVTVHCDDDYAFTGAGSDAAGVAFIRSGIAYLAPGVCRTLHGIMQGALPAGREDAAFAITVLAHEATHLGGVRNEAIAECYALQEGTRLGMRLGLERGATHDLMRTQLDRDLGDRSVARLGYRLPSGCRNGGRLDLRPGDPSFP